MRRSDILIAGGGLAGSLAAAVLGRAGYDVILVDPHETYPSDFRCEKLDGSQVAILRKTGLADAVLAAATPDNQSWVARFGHLVDKRAGDQHGILYDNLVNTVRGEIPPAVASVHAKVTGIATTADRQTVTLSNGDEVDARLVIVANGLNIGLRHALGIERVVLSECHSVTLGFDVRPRDRADFDFSSLTYYPERCSDRLAYLSLFPVGAAMRANLMVYRAFDDPWLQSFRRAPLDSMISVMPRLPRLTGPFEVAGSIKIRPADLYVSRGHLQPGIALVGDAFGTSCPAAGTGVGKVFTDVERLCNIHAPRWLATAGMGEDKIAQFYGDPVKQAYDAHSLSKAYHLRSLSIDDGLQWAARRWARFVSRGALGALRRARGRLTEESTLLPKAAAAPRAAWRRPA
jgi:2-polyprenyl-6-methoxyphenol hydroxylase-like FAD-dependent oxidoreductase